MYSLTHAAFADPSPHEVLRLSLATSVKLRSDRIYEFLLSFITNYNLVKWAMESHNH